MNDGSIPASRSLHEVVAAIDIAADEARFQAYRLRELVAPRTPAEAEHHRRLEREYMTAARILRRLRHYTQRRIDRADERGTLDQRPFDQRDAIDASGVAMAYPEDGDSPV